MGGADAGADFDAPPQAERTCQVGVRVQGRLKARLGRWRQIGASAEVLEWIEHGYRLPLTRWPPPHRGPGNHAGARAHDDWLRRAGAELVAAGALRKCAPGEVPRVVSPLDVVPKADYDPALKPDRLRMVIDTRWLNEFQEKLKFKYETLTTNRDMFERDDWLFSVDFTSGYYHVDIAIEHQELLGVEIGGEYYVFASLPFGLRDACRAFTMLVRAPVRYLRRQGVRVLPYIDDLLFALREHDEVERDRCVQLLRDLGFLVGDKSELDLSHSKKMLGFFVDTARMVFSLPQSRATKFGAVALRLLQRWAHGDGAPARDVAKVTGHVASMSLLLERDARLGCRFLNDSVRDAAASRRWNERVFASEGALGELRAWLERIPALPEAAIRAPPLLPPQLVLCTDASDVATGDFVAAVDGRLLSESERDCSMATVPLTLEQQRRGSALRELIGIERTLRRNAAACRGRRVEVKTDALASVCIFDNGGSQHRDPETGGLELHMQLLRVEAAAREAGCVSLSLVWHPRTRPDAQRADDASKVVDRGAWRLAPSLFAEVVRRLGKVVVDCFADEENHQLPEFHSRGWSPSAARFDTFTASWMRRPVYLCPDAPIVGRAVAKLRREGAFGIIVVPRWEGAAWWPLLFHSGIVVEAFDLPHTPAAFEARFDGSIVSPGCFHAPLLAARFDARAGNF